MVFLWIGVSWLIEHPPNRFLSMSALMASYRYAWFRQMAERDNRIFDAQIIANLRQATAFFASATMISLGAGAAALGNLERVQDVTADLQIAQAPQWFIEIKLLIFMAILLNAFLTFVWSNRLFGYCAVICGAMPNDPQDPDARVMAKRAAAVSINAARAFNRGLRAVYYALAASAWLLGEWALVAASVAVSMVLLRREFFSQSRAAVAFVPPRSAYERSMEHE